MNFPISPEKATEAICSLLVNAGGKADHLRIAKLIYLADRTSIIQRGVPIVGGKYYSLPKGPMISEVTNYANLIDPPSQWAEHISKRCGNEISLLKSIDYYHLAESELEILAQVSRDHRDKSTSELVTWCHENCPEYEHVWWGGRRRPIEVESMLSAAGKAPDVVSLVIQRARADQDLESLLHSHTA